HGRGVYEKGAGPVVDRLVQQSQHDHSGNVQQASRIFQPEESKIKNEKSRATEKIEGPDSQAGMTQHRIDEKKSQIDNPQQRTQSVIFVRHYKLPGFEPPGVAGGG